VSAGPPDRAGRLVLATAALAALAMVGGCRVDDQAFQGRVFSCDTKAADPLCGTDVNGMPMQCFAARQIGAAADFCTQRCDDLPMSLPDEAAVCVQGNAKLKYCNPADDNDAAGHPHGACDRSEFGCLRTDLIGDEGVCITMNPCLVDQDCHDNVRSTCAATFFKRLYASDTRSEQPVLHSDHLYCLQEGCDAEGSACSPGETCLRKVVPAAANPPDICVPNCDSHLRCPPNHFCLQKISGPANPAVCIPGLLGFVCATDVDCIIGSCRLENGADPPAENRLNLCTIACASDAECKHFDSEQGQFICNADHFCATPEAYRGATCVTDDDCGLDAGTICARAEPTDREGTCLHPCEADFSCAARGGINHTCVPLAHVAGPDPLALPEAAPVCFPGYFPLPCFSDDNCLRGLSCLGADLTTTPDPTPGICSVPCSSDDDCAQNHATAGAVCGAPALPICIPPNAQELAPPAQPAKERR
jgi:hypothetical protein